VLHDLGGLIDSFDLLIVFGILGNPGVLLIVSQLLLGFVGTFVVLDILGHQSHFLLGFSEGVGGVLSQFGQGNDLSLVVSDGLLEIIDQFLTGDFVVLENGVSSLLVTFNLGSDIVHQKIDLINWGTSGKVQLDHGQDRVAESLFVDFSKNGFVEFVLFTGECQSDKN
jgi:hypothetical protein